MKSDRIRQTIELAAVFLAAIGLIVLLTLSQYGSLYSATGDGDLYINMAQNLVEGHGLVNSLRNYDIITPPGLPLLIAAVLIVFRSVTAAIVLGYVAFGAGSVFLYLLARQLFKSRLAGIVAVLLHCFHPLIILNGPRYLVTETFFVCLMLAALYFFALMLDRERQEKLSRNLIVFFALVTAAILVRPHLLVMLVIGLLVAVVLFVKKKVRLRTLCAAICIPVVFFGANVGYNAALHGQPVFLENYGGINLYIANNPNSLYDWYDSTQLSRFVEPYYYKLSGDGEMFPEKSELLRERATAYMLRNPGLTAYRAMRRAQLLFTIHSYNKGYWIFALLGLAFSLVFCKRSRTQVIMVAATALSLIAITSLGPLMLRFSVPVLPYFFLFIGGIAGVAETLLRPLLMKLLGRLRPHKDQPNAELA